MRGNKSAYPSLPKWCNFIAPLTLIQQFLIIALFLEFLEHCTTSSSLDDRHEPDHKCDHPKLVIDLTDDFGRTPALLAASSGNLQCFQVRKITSAQRSYLKCTSSYYFELVCVYLIMPKRSFSSHKLRFRLESGKLCTYNT